MSLIANKSAKRALYAHHFEQNRFVTPSSTDQDQLNLAEEIRLLSKFHSVG